jgi:hypothetical protein
MKLGVHNMNRIVAIVDSMPNLNYILFYTTFPV